MKCNTAISGLNVQGLSSINYLISSSIKNNTLVISLKSNEMTWKKATIWMILHSRKDISHKITTLSIKFVIKQPRPI